jgi:arylsulfatase
VTQLTAHIDFFPTLAELAGAKLTDEVKTQVEGRSLVSLLENPHAAWADRQLFTHVGRWPKDADPQKYQFTNCSVRTSRWHLVSEARGGNPNAKAKAKNKAKNKAKAAAAPKQTPGILNAGPEAVAQPQWQLFDLQTDPGEQTDLAAANPDVVKQLTTAYTQWWDSVQPLLVNEKAPLAAENPFKTLYQKQFGGK